MYVYDLCSTDIISNKMAQLTRNDSAGVISSLMHYGDSDDEDNSSSRNNSVDERSAEVKGEESTQRGEEAMEEGEATAADATSTLTTQVSRYM